MRVTVWAIGPDLAKALEYKNFYTTEAEATAVCDERNKYATGYLEHDWEIFQIEVKL